MPILGIFLKYGLIILLVLRPSVIICLLSFAAGGVMTLKSPQVHSYMTVISDVVDTKLLPVVKNALNDADTNIPVDQFYAPEQ